MSKEAKWEPGKGRTFTPSLGAKWVDEFNSLSASEGKSRNALTEELLVLGLKARDSSNLFISTNGLTEEQVGLLSSQEGQKILLNLALALVGKSSPIISGGLIADNNSDVNQGTSRNQDNTVTNKAEELQTLDLVAEEGQRRIMEKPTTREQAQVKESQQKSEVQVNIQAKEEEEDSKKAFEIFGKIGNSLKV